MRRHYTDNDFIVTSVSYGMPGYCRQYGYCRVCGGDMQQFMQDGLWGHVFHYNSHKHGGVKTAIPARPKQLTPLEKILKG